MVQLRCAVQKWVKQLTVLAVCGIMVVREFGAVVIIIYIIIFALINSRKIDRIAYMKSLADYSSNKTCPQDSSSARVFDQSALITKKISEMKGQGHA